MGEHIELRAAVASVFTLVVTSHPHSVYPVEANKHRDSTLHASLSLYSYQLLLDVIRLFKFD